MVDKKTISPEARLTAFALFTMAQRHVIEARKFETQLCELLGYEDDWAGCLSDELYDPNGSFERGLKRDGFVVRKAAAKKSRPSRRDTK